MASAAAFRVLPTDAELFQAAAVEFSARARNAVREHGRFTVALAGGSTPKALFQLLAGGTIPDLPWSEICFFWGDERHVPPDHHDSNYRMANEAMLSKVPLRAANVFRIPAEGADPNAVAESYERTLQTFFELGPGEFPRFDLILLGMGPDGHTASLFPGTAALQQTRKIFVSNWVPKLNEFRFTLTFPAINHTASALFLVSGRDKALALKQVRESENANLPAQGVHPDNGTLLWLVDQAAAGKSL